MEYIDPTFPPLLAGRPVRAPDRPFTAACHDALGGTTSAGDVYWARNNRTLDCAIVLEPEVDLASSLQMAYVVMVAFGDAFGVMAEPEVGLYYHWPNRLLINGGEVGRLRIAAPRGVGFEQVPDWMVFNLMIEMQGDDDIEPGMNLEKTTLFDEGCGEITCAGLTESFCRHFLSWVHAWEEDGFRQIHDTWIARAVGCEGSAEFDVNGEIHTGRVLGLNEMSQLVISKEGGTVAMLDFQHMVEWQGEG
jgi:BirA family transcriptional regulator, biotin operon repressor / biotin---[acetyl-CoA-carboxylase] ligase